MKIEKYNRFSWVVEIGWSQGFVIINGKYRVLFLCFQFLIPFLLLVFNYSTVRFFFFFGTTLVILEQLFLWGYVHACSVIQSCLSPCDPMDCSLPGFSVHGIFSGKNTREGCHFLLRGIFPTQGPNLLLEWLLHWQILHHWATQEAPSAGIARIIS